jgi:hypothetical protein
MYLLRAGPWIGQLQDHGVLAEPSVFESIVYAGTWLPYPMKPFELVLSVRWVDLVQACLTTLNAASGFPSAAASEDTSATEDANYLNNPAAT